MAGNHRARPRSRHVRFDAATVTTQSEMKRAAAAGQSLRTTRRHGHGDGRRCITASRHHGVKRTRVAPRARRNHHWQRDVMRCGAVLLDTKSQQKSHRRAPWATNILHSSHGRMIRTSNAVGCASPAAAFLRDACGTRREGRAQIGAEALSRAGIGRPAAVVEGLHEAAQRGGVESAARTDTSELQ